MFCSSNNLASPNSRNLDEPRIFQQLSIEMYKQLYGLEKKNHDKISNILNLYEHLKYTTSEVPTTLTLADMIYMLKVYPDEKELHRSIKFFYKRECHKYKSRKKKVERKIQIREKKVEKYGQNEDEWSVGIWDTNQELVYGLWHNSILGRITKKSVRDFRHNHLLRHAAMFGQKLIIDLDYDQYMKMYEANLLASQIGVFYYENRNNETFPNELPFDIHFTNCDKSTITLEALRKHIKRMDELKFYFHHGSYLDNSELFPRENLVYLSPHASQSLRQYSHDDIYILGGYNDRSTHMKVSHVKARAEGIRCYRLPLDENVLWKQGNKNLCLNQVGAILHAVKATGDWQYAIRTFTPQRKIKSAEEMELEDEIRIKKIHKRLKHIEKSGYKNF